MDLVKDYLTLKTPLCTPLTSIENINRIMDENGADELFVIDSMEERRLVGVIYKEDIDELSRLEAVDPNSLSAQRCMRLAPACANEETSLLECQQILDDNHLDHLAVVDNEGHFCGTYDRFNFVELKSWGKMFTEKSTEEAASEMMINEGSPAASTKKP